MVAAAEFLRECSPGLTLNVPAEIYTAIVSSFS